MNPVTAMLVKEEDHYLFSSAKDYFESKGMVEIELLQ